MRAIETIIRTSTERLSSRQTRGWLTPARSRAIVICGLGAGFALVAIWAVALLYMLYSLIAWALT